MPVSLSGVPSYGASTPLHLEVVSTDPHLVPTEKGTYEVPVRGLVCIFLWKQRSKKGSHFETECLAITYLTFILNFILKAVMFLATSVLLRKDKQLGMYWLFPA